MPLNTPQAPVASVAASSGVQNGMAAATAYPAPVANGQLALAMSDKAGRTIVVPMAPRDLVSTASAQTTSSSLSSLIAAGGTNVYTDIVTFIATNESASATVVTLTDGTATYKFALASNGGIVINFPTPLPATSANTAWQVSNSASDTVDCVAVYVSNH
jgi:hypothetical protein